MVSGMILTINPIQDGGGGGGGGKRPPQQFILCNLDKHWN